MQLRRERRPGLAGTGDSETDSVPWASLHPHRQPTDLQPQPAGRLFPPRVRLLQGSGWIAGYKANVRSTDGRVLGIVSDRYKVVQNQDAFQFTDELLGEGVTYETAGSLQMGWKVWMLARMPQRYIIAGDEIAHYLVIMNSHDGSSGVKVAMAPIRVVCQNTLTISSTILLPGPRLPLCIC